MQFLFHKKFSYGFRELFTLSIETKNEWSHSVLGSRPLAKFLERFRSRHCFANVLYKYN